MKLRTILPALSAIVIAGALAPRLGQAHCQVPCGIYDDEARFTELAQHLTTIEKAMTQIAELSAAAQPDHNQLVRWVTNKDQHADAFADIVSYYFLAQRIKAPADSGARDTYLQKLEALHKLTVGAMKCKQQVDTGLVETLRADLARFRELYFAD